MYVCKNIVKYHIQTFTQHRSRCRKPFFFLFLTHHESTHTYRHELFDTHIHEFKKSRIKEKKIRI